MTKHLTDSEVVPILSTALLHILDDASKGRIDNCESIGYVHSTVDKQCGSIQTWIIKFDPKTCAFSLIPTETDKYPEGAVLYWYESNDDSVTQAALFSDDIIHET